MKTSDTEIGLGVMLLRQLRSLVDAGRSLNDAGSELRAQLSPPMQSRLDTILRALEDPGADAQTPYQVIIARARQHGADPLESVLQYARVTDRLSAVQMRLSAAIQSSVALFIVTGLIAILIVLIVRWALVPFFAGFGVEMPLLTRVMYISGGGWVSYSFAALAGAMIFGLVMLVRDIRSSLLTLDPMPKHWNHIPLVGIVASRLRHVAAVLTAISLRAGGLSSVRAVEISGEVTGEPLAAARSLEVGREIAPERYALALARDVGNLDAELDWQARNLADLVDADLGSLIRKLEGFLMAIIAILVGTLVISIYLPIFRLGSSVVG